MPFLAVPVVVRKPSCRRRLSLACRPGVQGGEASTTGSLADGGAGLLLDGVSLDATAADIHVLTLAGTSPYSGMPVDTSSSAPLGVDTISSLLEVSADLRDAGSSVAPVMGITHTNSNLKNARSSP
jgi:hypothetical protein